jgi:penicillin-binding protein 1C
MKRALRRFRQLRRWQQGLIACALLMGIGAWVLYGWLWAGLPSLDTLEAGFALPSTRIFDRHGRLLYEILPPDQGRNVVLALDDIPQHCQNAVIATEDANFYRHPGVDPVGVARALWINLRGGEVLAGGSTITQQAARLLLLDPEQRAERTLQRKLREMILALQLQGRLSKDEVLALYLNQAYFGNLAYGIEAAARAYFGEAARDLSLAECALLAGILQNPVAHDPLIHLNGAKARQEVALDLMVANGYIIAEDRASALADTLQFASARFPIEAPHAVMAVWTTLARDYPDRLYRDGLDVVTTIDLDWQRTAETVVSRQITYLNTPEADRPAANAQNAALVALDPFTGEILTLLGSPDYFDERIDGAVNGALAQRQPGSALKPFTYAAAMNPDRSRPWTAATLVWDVRTAFVTRRLERYVPGNYGLVEHGPVLVREALASSYNIPAVVALDDVGIAPMVELAANAGLTTLLDNSRYDLSVTLGGGEVRLLDLAGAYSIFPNGGYRIEPSLLLSVTVRETGETLYTWTPPALERPVLDARVARIITDILSDPEARRPGFGWPSPLDIGRPAAAKTGTTTDFRDNWVVGYTPDLVVGVWVGNANNSPMVDVTGISGAAPIWNDFLRRVLTGEPESEFPPHTGLAQVEICALSGLLPTPECANRRLEWFIPDTAPTELDTLHQRATIDRRTGQLATTDTPPEWRNADVFIALPPEAQAWGRANGLRLLPVEFAQTEESAQVADAAPVRLLSPDPYSLYQLSPTAPAETQRLRLAAAAPHGTHQVIFALNGQPVAEVEGAPWEVRWPLQIGQFELVAEAHLADGTRMLSAPVTFEVVEYQEPGARARLDPLARPPTP